MIPGLTLDQAIPVVEAAIAQINDRSGNHRDNPIAYRKRHKAACEEAAQHLAEFLGARINDRWDGCRVTILKVSSTCTAGMLGCLGNWCHAAKRKLEQAA